MLGFVAICLIEPKPICDGKLSGYLPVVSTAGIPQGSVLGPSLFLLFMNDMPNAVQDIFINLYADDTLLYYASDDITVIQYKLQLAVDKVIRWFTQNQLKINVTKSCVCVIGTRQRRAINSDLSLIINIYNENLYPLWIHLTI